jgi:hypothetical protein
MKVKITLSEEQKILLDCLGSKWSFSDSDAFYLPMVFYRIGDVWEVQDLSDVPDNVKQKLGIHDKKEEEINREGGGGD